MDVARSLAKQWRRFRGMDSARLLLLGGFFRGLFSLGRAARVDDLAGSAAACADDFAFGTREGLLPVPIRQGDSALVAFDFVMQRAEGKAAEGFSARTRATA